MGKLTATSFITLDNVVEDPHLWSGDYFSDETGALNDAVLRPADAMVLGRTTYEGFAAAWPSRSGDPFSDKFNSMPKYVVSTTLETADWNNTTIISSDPFARDETMMGFGFPKEWRDAALEAEPEKFVRPKTADLRYNWLVVRLAAIDGERMEDLVTEAWSMVVPQRVVDEWMASRASG